MALVLAGLALIPPGGPEPAGAQDSPLPLGSELTTTRTCLGGNGRVDSTFVNTGDAAATYRLQFEGLSPREITLTPGDFGRIPITGRADRDYTYLVSRTSQGNVQPISSRVIRVRCDSQAPLVTTPEVVVINACRAGNGFITLQLANPTAAPRPYVIQFDGVANRSQTAAAFGAATRAITGRPDGTYNLTIRSGAEIVYATSVTVGCSAALMPTPTAIATPSPQPTPIPVDGIDATVGVVINCVAIGDGRVAVTVNNNSDAAVPASLVVVETASESGQVRSGIAQVGQPLTLTQAGLAPATYRVTVSIAGITVYDETQNLLCAPTPTPAPPTPTPTPAPPTPTPTPAPPTPTPTATPVPNMTPAATADAVTVQEDDGAVDITAILLDNDSDPDAGDVLTITGITTAGTGLAALTDGQVTYDPNGQFEHLPEFLADGPETMALDTFTYTVADGNGATSTAAVTVTIEGNNDAPTVVDDFVVGVGNAEIAFDPLDNDVEIDDFDLLFTQNVQAATPQGGSATAPANTVVRYQPASGADYSPPVNRPWPLFFTGFDTVTYDIVDSSTTSPSMATILVGSEMPQPYEIGTTAPSTVARETRENWFHFTLEEDSELWLDSDCGFRQEGGLEFQIINSSNVSVANLSCNQDTPRSYAAGTYAIRVFSLALDMFDINSMFSLQVAPAPDGPFTVSLDDAVSNGMIGEVPVPAATQVG